MLEKASKNNELMMLCAQWLTLCEVCRAKHRNVRTPVSTWCSHIKHSRHSCVLLVPVVPAQVCCAASAPLKQTMRGRLAKTKTSEDVEAKDAIFLFCDW